MALLHNGVDSYNELDHQRLSSQAETAYISQMLTKIKHHGCHVWFVAHPRQVGAYLERRSSKFIRHQWKCKLHKHVWPYGFSAGGFSTGAIGDAYLSYDRVMGEYADFDAFEYG